MQMVERMNEEVRGERQPFGTIIELESIIRRCPLAPLFGNEVDWDLDFATVLEEFSEFLINPFASRLDYDAFKFD